MAVAESHPGSLAPSAESTAGTASLQRSSAIFSEELVHKAIDLIA
jgi:hypothetical protein